MQGVGGERKKLNDFKKDEKNRSRRGNLDGSIFTSNFSVFVSHNFQVVQVSKQKSSFSEQGYSCKAIINQIPTKNYKIDR